MANRITAVIDVVADKAKREVQSFRQAVQEADGAVGKVKAGASSFGDTLRRNTGASLAVAGAAAIKFGSDAVAAASNLEESVNAVNVAYGDAAEGVHELGANSVESFGLSQRAFNEAATSLSGFVNQIGGGSDTLDKLVGRATDFASVFNLDVSEALQVFQSTLSGETEPIRRFGKDLSAAAVEAHALESGLIASKKEMTEAIKVQARYSLLMRETADVAGDFENTQDSLANQSKTLQGNLENLQAEIGGHLIPAVAEATENLNDMLGVLDDLGVVDAGFKVKELADEFGAFSTSSRYVDKMRDALGKMRSAGEFTDEQIQELRETVEEFGQDSQEAADLVDGWREAAERSALAAGIATDVQRAYAEAQHLAEQATKAMAAAAEEKAEADEAAEEAAERHADAMREQAERAEDLTDKLADLVGGSLGVERAQIRAADAASEYDATIQELNESGLEGEELERRKREAFLDAADAQLSAAEAAADYEIAQREANGETLSAEEKNRLLVWQLGKVAGTLAPGSPLRVQLEDYIAELNRIPNEVSTALTVKGQWRDLNQWIERINSIPGLKPTVFTSGGTTRVAGATGGIVNGPTQALIGEAGPEAVIPLDRVPGNSPLPDSLGAGGSPTYNITVNAGMGAKGADIGRDIVDALKRYERSNGTGWRE